MRLFTLLISFFFFSDCLIRYPEFPMEYQNRKPAGKTQKKMYYRVRTSMNIDMAGGLSQLKQSILQDSPYEMEEYVYIDPQTSEQRDKVPEKGLFIDAKLNYTPPSVLSFIFGYVSVATLTILPAWSREDGYNVDYTIFKDGQIVKKYSYRVRREAYLWAGLLPFI